MSEDTLRAFLTVSNILTQHDYNGLSSMVMIAMREIAGEEEQPKPAPINADKYPHIAKVLERRRQVEAACTRSPGV